MYLSICTNDFMDIKAGEVVDTYQKLNYAFIKPKGSSSDFKELHIQEYSSYFIDVKDSLLIPVTSNRTISYGLFKKKTKTITEVYEEFVLLDKLHFDDLIKIQLTIIEPINKLYIFKGFEKHTNSLYEVLKEIEALQSLGYLVREEIQAKIMKAETLIKEVEEKVMKLENGVELLSIYNSQFELSKRFHEK